MELTKKYKSNNENIIQNREKGLDCFSKTILNRGDLMFVYDNEYKIIFRNYNNKTIAIK